MSSDDPSAPGHGPPGNDARASDGTVTTATDPSSDQLLRIATGDRSAFEELFVAQSRILMAVILRIVRSQSLAEEVLQECFTEVWTRCSGFDPQRGTGRAWLITLARRRAIDCVRSVQAQQNRDYADGLRASAEEGEQVEQTVIDRIRVGQNRHCVEDPSPGPGTTHRHGLLPGPDPR